MHFEWLDSIAHLQHMRAEVKMLQMRAEVEMLQQAHKGYRHHCRHLRHAGRQQRRVSGAAARQRDWTLRSQRSQLAGCHQPALQQHDGSQKPGSG